ncbi:helix-turn-helix domain-containing protein [Dactylosporangium sp. NPDC049742]|uniref:TetR/AcrR family transcriptional regulator n=1 Tax=Dactylosporangium sp. NPDC049742 TaxID=3154737 RepID=UPI0034269B1D
MARWEPDARGRLMLAALALYTERGYEQTTVADIAQRAGVTERTFFRHFADKREVLFDGSGMLQDTVVAAIAAYKEAPPLDVVGAAMERAAVAMQDRRDFARQRAAIIAATPSLHERELLKLATLGTAAAAALRDRGVPPVAAALAAELGVAVFKVAFEQWITCQLDFPACIRATLDELSALHSPSPAPRP